MALYKDVNQKNPQKQAFLTDIDVIYQSLNNIIQVRKTTRLFNVEFGDNLGDSLFELADEFLEDRILKSVIEAVERWEPRVRLLYGKSSVLVFPDKKRAEVLLVFKVLGLGEEEFEYSKGLKS